MSDERIDIDAIGIRESIELREREILLPPLEEDGEEGDPITLLTASLEDVTIGDLVSHIRAAEKREARILGVETREVTTPLPPPAE
jgi:hypothetical protein